MEYTLAKHTPEANKIQLNSTYKDMILMTYYVIDLNQI